MTLQKKTQTNITEIGHKFLIIDNCMSDNK